MAYCEIGEIFYWSEYHPRAFPLFYGTVESVNKAAKELLRLITNIIEHVIIRSLSRQRKKN